EVWRVRLRNLTRRARRLDLFTYFEWNLGPAPDSHREFHRLLSRPAPGAGALLVAKRGGVQTRRGAHARRRDGARARVAAECPHRARLARHAGALANTDRPA